MVVNDSNSGSSAAAAKPTINGAADGADGGVVGNIGSSAAAAAPPSPPPPAYQAHPLGPLSGDEITRSSDLIRKAWPEGTLFQFKVITLLEPAKAQLVPYLDAERKGQSPLAIDRRSFVVYYLRNTDKLHEAVVNLTQDIVESNVLLGPNVHPNGDAEELFAVEKALFADAGVQAEIAKLKLPEGTVVVSDPWIYGSDGVDDDSRLFQCFLYMRDPKNPKEEDGCHYAFPLPISPVVDPTTMKVVRIDIMPTGLDSKVEPVKPWEPAPPNEYIPEAQPAIRTGLKPLHVVQPEGASFQVSKFSENGHTINWQKWDLKVGFNQREGMVLYDVHYDSKPLFYRLSLSDMAIPYADPRHPFHKKAAFDLGDAGAGIMANNLKLGCDCLGSIYYISGVLCDSHGKPVPYPNVICVHEQDAGIMWKHTNYRTDRACIVRSRELVLQTILTVSNYEYILAWIFNLAGDITYEVRATGILSTQPVDQSLTTTPHPYGTIVHPGVLAGHHQHFFSLRLDPMVAGHGNTVVYDDAVPLPRDPVENPHGVAYTLSSTTIHTSGGYDLSPAASRTYRIANPSLRNPVNGHPASYKLSIPPMQPILADQDSFHHKRAEFADRSVYVTRYAEGELFAGGLYTNQSRGGTGVRSWASRGDSLDAGDPVVWVQFGINHIPRVEDFPVMPCEMLRVTMRPCNFFERNPALDVPQSTQEVNCSVGLNGHAFVDKAVTETEREAAATTTTTETTSTNPPGSSSSSTAKAAADSLANGGAIDAATFSDGETADRGEVGVAPPLVAGAVLEDRAKQQRQHDHHHQSAAEENQGAKTLGGERGQLSGCCGAHGGGGGA